MSANRPGLAIAELEQALRQDPGNHEIMKSLGNAHKAAGDLGKAADCYRRSLGRAADYAPSLYNLGLVLHELNRLEEAEELFRRAHQITPNDADILVHLGVILCKRSRFAEGADMFRTALRVAPEDPKLWLWLARACHEIPHEIDESIQCLRKCIALDPGFADAYCQLGVAYRKVGDSRQAAEAFGKALELEPGSADAIDGLGDMLQDEGRLDEAIEHWKKAVEIQPDNIAASNGLALMLVHTGDNAGAITQWQNTLRFDPDNFDAANNLAWLLCTTNDPGLRDPAQALELARHAVELAREASPAAYRTLAVAYAENSRFDEAITAAQHGIALCEAIGNRALAADLERCVEIFKNGKTWREARNPQ